MFEDLPIGLIILAFVIFVIIRRARNAAASLAAQAARTIASSAGHGAERRLSNPRTAFDAPSRAPAPDPGTRPTPWGGTAPPAPPPLPDITLPELLMPEPTGPVFRFKTADEIIRDAFGKVTVLSGDPKPRPSDADRS
ncbi:MAG: hypothetical protein HLUCCA08_17410 [Rhodobacteraceae bacterium HLUCCA08]|nr:MAG: hypothetical protein HLUCCA08_17410 [Rhodobacteraceae bacterium HLUCCA08]